MLRRLRATGTLELANELVALIEGFPRLQLSALDRALTNIAVQVAGSHRLRGADSIYVAVAASFESELVTWDNEMRERATGIVTACTPGEWLDANAGRPRIRG